MKLFFAGEGNDDLGEWAGDPTYRPEHPEGGILHALVTRFGESTTVDACIWRKVRKYRVGRHDAPEAQTVLGLALRAEELQCDALVFARDRDRDLERERDVENGIRTARERFRVQIVGGTANEEVEAWLLAMLARRRAPMRKVDFGTSTASSTAEGRSRSSSARSWSSCQQTVRPFIAGSNERERVLARPPQLLSRTTEPRFGRRVSLKLAQVRAR